MTQGDGYELRYLENENGQLSFDFCTNAAINDYDKVAPPLRYPGSKFRAAKHILPFIQYDYDEYREPFFGGGAIFFKLPLVKVNWINDIDKNLMTTYKVIADNEKRRILQERVKRVEPSKEYFEKLKYMDYKEEIDIAFQYFVINRTAYSGIMNKPNFGFHKTKSVQPDKWPLRIEEAGEKLKSAKITSLHYREVITAEPKGKNVFMFIDPPYYKADQKRAYYHSFTENDHFELLELLKNTTYKFCLTYDDCAETRDMYSWANINGKRWMYHTANSNQTTRKEGKELVITNY